MKRKVKFFAESLGQGAGSMEIRFAEEGKMC
jgi:hypothetical protein